MNQPAAVLISMGPFVLLILAAFLRGLSAIQPETQWSGRRRYRLNVASYVLTGVAIAGMVLTLSLSPIIGFSGLVLLSMIGFMFFGAEVRVSGARKRAQQVEFIWLLALAAKSGRPLADEIESYAEGTWGKRYQSLSDMAQRLRDGVPLTELAVPQGLLPRTASMHISAAIAASSLEDTLRDTAVRLTRELSEDDDSTDATGALVYPVAVVPITFLVVAFLMYYIIPKFKKIFDDFGTELPQLTIYLIKMSDTVINFWYLFGLPLFYVPMALLIFASMAQYYGWRNLMQSIFGRWFIRWYSPEVMRALAQCIRQKIPIDQALIAIGRFPGPLRLRQRLTWAAGELENGGPSWQTLQSAGLLRHYETIVLETAEQTGNLPWALETLANNMERRTAFRIYAALEIVRPILLIGIAIFVGFVSIALFLPLVKLLNDLS